jgi:hypothetical protein
VREELRVRVVREQGVHQETVTLHRHEVDLAPRPAPGADELEITARGEEAVVGREACIVERVHVGNVVGTRTETIDETERRRSVKVENIDDDRRDPLHRR